MHLESMIVRTCRPQSSKSGDTLGGPKSSEIGQVLGGHRWTAPRDSIHQFVNLQPWECDKVTLPLKL